MPLDEFKLAGTQSTANASTRGQWDWYAHHRRQIERLIVPPQRGMSIAVLGAGNCNDIDLRWLSEVYARVRLVDIDPAALERGVEKQQARGIECVHADLTGIADTVAAWKGRAVSEAEVEAAVVKASQVTEHTDKFDVVLSPCVLSQLLVSVRDVIGHEHAGWKRLKAAIRARHLREIGGMLSPGGRGVMIVDFSSTSVLPGLDRANGSDIPGLMRRACADRKCFHGMEPAEMTSAARREGLKDIKVSDAWIWHLGWGKAFLCYGLSLTATDNGEEGIRTLDAV